MGQFGGKREREKRAKICARKKDLERMCYVLIT